MLDVPRELVAYVSRLLAAERRVRGTRRGSRALTCWREALFVLAWFRKREDLTVLGAGFGISRSTAYRYHAEGLDVLAAQAPELTGALHRVQADGWAYSPGSQPSQRSRSLRSQPCPYSVLPVQRRRREGVGGGGQDRTGLSYQSPHRTSSGHADLHKIFARAEFRERRHPRGRRP